MRYRPDDACLPRLGAIVGLLQGSATIDRALWPSARLFARLPGGQIYIDSEFVPATPGAGATPGGATGAARAATVRDATAQESGNDALSNDMREAPETAFNYADGTSLDAERVPFIVLPEPSDNLRRLRIGLGDIAAFVRGERLAFGVFGDVGPEHTIGAASATLLRRLNYRADPTPSGGGTQPDLICIIFPGSGRAEDRAGEAVLLNAIDRRGPALFAALGGAIDTSP